MTFRYQSRAGLEKPMPTRLTSVSVTAIAVGYDLTRTITKVGIANETGSAATLKLYYYDGTTNNLIWNGSIAANGYDEYTGPLRLGSGDELRAEAGTANALTCNPIIALQTPNIGQLDDIRANFGGNQSD